MTQPSREEMVAWLDDNINWFEEPKRDAREYNHEERMVMWKAIRATLSPQPRPLRELIAEGHTAAWILADLSGTHGIQLMRWVVVQIFSESLLKQYGDAPAIPILEPEQPCGEKQPKENASKLGGNTEGESK